MFKKSGLSFEPLSAVWVATSGIETAPDPFAAGNGIWLSSEALWKLPSIKNKQCAGYDLGGSD
jgi:hypothetical protein